MRFQALFLMTPRLVWVLIALHKRFLCSCFSPSIVDVPTMFIHDKSSPSLIHTAPDSPPENVSVAAISSTSVSISWTPPPQQSRNGHITEYRINISEIDTGRVQLHTSFTTPFVVQRLHPYYTYEIAVSAHTVSTGPYSGAEIIQTPEDGK